MKPISMLGVLLIVAGIAALVFGEINFAKRETVVQIGDAKLAGAFSRRLFEEGIFAMSIGYPTVARDKARIRAMISATHSAEDLKFALEVFGRVGRELAILH